MFAIGSVHFCVIFKFLLDVSIVGDSDGYMGSIAGDLNATDSANARINSVTQPLIATCYSNTYHTGASYVVMVSYGDDDDYGTNDDGDDCDATHMPRA